MTKLTIRDPFRSFFAMPNWVDDFDNSLATQRGLTIREQDNSILIEAVVAGIPADDVEVHIEDGVLTIKAVSEKEEKGKNLHKRSSYQYYYTAALSGGQWDKAEAEVEHGVLRLTIPKAEAARPRKIKVKARGKK